MCMCRSEDDFKSLVDQKVGDDKGKTALHLAIQQKKFTRARILLDEDFDAGTVKLFNVDTLNQDTLYNQGTLHV